VLIVRVKPGKPNRSQWLRTGRGRRYESGQWVERAWIG
jgi:hypothetical protein